MLKVNYCESQLHYTCLGVLARQNWITSCNGKAIKRQTRNSSHTRLHLPGTSCFITVRMRLSKIFINPEVSILQPFQLQPIFPTGAEQPAVSWRMLPALLWPLQSYVAARQCRWPTRSLDMLLNNDKLWEMSSVTSTVLLYLLDIMLGLILFLQVRTEHVAYYCKAVSEWWHNTQGTV